MKSSILTLFLTLICMPAFCQNVYLVAVGIADYPGTKYDLALPVADASAMIDLYNSNKSTQVRLIINNNATRKNIIETTHALFNNARPNDIVVLFFSGHGYPGGFMAYDSNLDYADVKSIFSSCKSRHKMVFADACFSGTLRDTNNGKQKANTVYNGDVMLFLSSRHNESSFEVPSMNNGLFTTCLVRCLKGGSDFNGDRVITAKELYTGVSEGVIQLSRGRQHPVMWGSFNDEMTVLKWH